MTLPGLDWLCVASSDVWFHGLGETVEGSVTERGKIVDEGHAYARQVSFLGTMSPCLYLYWQTMGFSNPKTWSWTHLSGPSMVSVLTYALLPWSRLFLGDSPWGPVVYGSSCPK